MDKKLAANFAHWDIPRDFAEPMANYLIHGWEPGGFMTALLANDCWRAVGSAHPAVSMDNVKDLVRWLMNVPPRSAIGSYEKVKAWSALTDEQRREVLEARGIVMTMWEHLKDTGER